MKSDKSGLVKLYKWSIFEKFSPNLTAAVSCRDGGVSKKQYSSLNLGLHTEDNNPDIIENRKRVCKTLNVKFNSYTTAKQIHSSNIKLISNSDVGSGFDSYKSAINDCDALITNQKNCTLVINVADCMAIALYDPINQAIGLAHAGWKGSAGNIAAKTVSEMKKHFNSNPKDLIVGLSPAIGICCYQVSYEVIEEFLKLGLERDDIAIKDNEEGKWKLNLSECNSKLLEYVGVSADKIEKSEICTSCNSEEFFSYRKSGGDTGRFSAFLNINNN